jgi:two-component system sensor histidine kinase VicK
LVIQERALTSSPQINKFSSIGNLKETSISINSQTDGRQTERDISDEPDAISIMSHELLSPLNLIKGYIDTLQQLADTVTEERRKQYLQGIANATDRVIRLLDNFRNSTQFELTAPNLCVQPTSLPDLLSKTISEIQNQTRKHIIRLRYFNSLPLVNVDPWKIEQVMVNLLTNAVKYSPEGGDIDVTAWQAYDEHELKEILVTVPTMKFPCLIISITDTGIGIPEEEQGQIIKPFYRVNNSFARTVSGAGLGLNICKSIIEAHGGSLWINSIPHKGSTFSFSLPVS